MLFGLLGVWIVSYLIGAIPVGFLVARLKGVHDLRNHGSGATGATNSARVLGYPYFFLIFLIDAGKAYALMAWVLQVQSGNAELLLALSGLLLGNTVNIFLRGRAGKGVATYFGIVSAIAPLVMMHMLIFWTATLILVRTVGLASIVAMVIASIMVWTVALPLSLKLSLAGSAMYVLALHYRHVLTAVKSHRE